MPLFPPDSDNSVSIEPQYDGVVMLSPDVVFFNDAQPRPDGRKIYHIFEHSCEENSVEDEPDKVKKDYDSKKNELFSKASEQSLQNIQQVLAKNGISMQDWCTALTPTLASQVLQPNGSVCKQDTLDSSASELHCSLALPNLDSQEILSTLMHQRINNSTLLLEDELEGLIDYHNFKLYKVYQFYMNFPNDLQSSLSKSKLLKRLQRRGVFDVQYEPENFRITLKTLRSAQFILKILRKIDQNVFLLSTTYDLVISEPEYDESDILGLSKNLKDL